MGKKNKIDLIIYPFLIKKMENPNYKSLSNIAEKLSLTDRSMFNENSSEDDIDEFVVDNMDFVVTAVKEQLPKKKILGSCFIDHKSQRFAFIFGNDQLIITRSQAMQSGLYLDMILNGCEYKNYIKIDKNISLSSIMTLSKLFSQGHTKDPDFYSYLSTLYEIEEYLTLIDYLQIKYD
jgi:hypothetical protein